MTEAGLLLGAAALTLSWVPSAADPAGDGKARGTEATAFAGPIRQMRLVDAYGADDRRSMAADNTSAFNCRFVAGRPGVWSEHAYGRASNPYFSANG